MNKRGYVLGYRLALALAPALLFGLLAYATLVALPLSAASEIPNWSDREIALTPLADPSVFTVTGVVERQEGTGVAAVQVFVFGGLANAFVSAAPQPPPSAGFFGDWGRFAGADGFYALALQPGIYSFTVSPPGEIPLPKIILPIVDVTQDLALDFDYHCLFLPIVLRGY